MSNDHHHHCDCCTTQCRQQGLESLVKLTTTSTMKPRWNHISGAISGRFFLNIGRQCFDGEGRPLLFFSIPEIPMCSLWDREGRLSHKRLDGFFFLMEFQASQGSLEVSRLSWWIVDLFHSLNFYNPQSFNENNNTRNAFNQILKTEDTKWSSSPSITPCVNSLDSMQMCHIFCCQEHTRQEDQSGQWNDRKREKGKGKREKGKGKREKGKGKREKGKGEKNGKKTGKKILHIIAHKISCRKTSSKQSTKDAEATTGLPTHLQR